MGIDGLLVVSLAVIAGIYGIFWHESRKTGLDTELPRTDRAEVR